MINSRTSFLPFAILFFVSNLLAFLQCHGQSLKLDLDKERSRLKWKGEKLGGFHTGFVEFESGQIYFDGKSVSSGSLIMKMETIVCTDIKSEKYNQKLIRHLKGEDFFNTDKFKYASLEVLDFRNGKEQNTGWITGMLTIKEISHEVDFPVSFELKNNSWVFQGETSIDRSKYQIRYKSPSFFNNLGDGLIYDEFKLEFYLVFIQPSKL